MWINAITRDGEGLGVCTNAQTRSTSVLCVCYVNNGERRNESLAHRNMYLHAQRWTKLLRPAADGPDTMCRLKIRLHRVHEVCTSCSVYGPLYARCPVSIHTRINKCSINAALLLRGNSRGTTIRATLFSTKGRFPGVSPGEESTREELARATTRNDNTTWQRARKITAVKKRCLRVVGRQTTQIRSIREIVGEIFSLPPSRDNATMAG